MELINQDIIENIIPKLDKDNNYLNNLLNIRKVSKIFNNSIKNKLHSNVDIIKNIYNNILQAENYTYSCKIFTKNCIINIISFKRVEYSIDLIKIICSVHINYERVLFIRDYFIDNDDNVHDLLEIVENLITIKSNISNKKNIFEKIILKIVNFIRKFI